MHKFNYTNRQKLHKADIGIETYLEREKIYFKLNHLNVEDYNLPYDSKVILEAYRQNKMMSFSLGTIKNLIMAPEDNYLNLFHDLDEILFRLKVTAGSNSALLLARADGIKAKKLNSNKEGSGESLLPIISDELGEEVWKIEFENGPRLLINKKFRKEEVGADNIFRSLVMPQVMNQILNYLFFVECSVYDQDYPDGSWQHQWYSFAKELADNNNPPKPDDDRTDIFDWIDMVVSSFAQQQQCSTAYKI